MTSYSGSSVNRAASQSAKDSRQEGHARETTFIVVTFLKRWDTPQHVDNDQIIRHMPACVDRMKMLNEKSYFFKVFHACDGRMHGFRARNRVRARIVHANRFS